MKRNALVIGGGLAGLTTALRLGEKGYAVTLLEAESTLGGRLSHRIDVPDTDAIPPVLMGWHQASRSLLNTLGTASCVHFRSGLSLEFLIPGRRPHRLSRPVAPAPFHTIAGLAIFRGLALRDRWRFLMWLERTWEKDPALPADLDNHTAEAWLRGTGQSETARLQTWTPLSRFLLGDDLKTVSAALFLTVLIRSFLSSRRHSMLAVPSGSLHSLMVQPAIDRLHKLGVTVRLKTPVSHIHLNTHRVTGIHLEGGETIMADWYVAAMPHRSLGPLLPERAVTHFSYFQQLSQLKDSAALTAHLRVKSKLDRPRVVLLAGRTYHWVVLRPCEDNSDTLASLVATGQPGLLNRSDDELMSLAMDDLRTACHKMPAMAASAHHIVREPQAFLSVRPRSTALRPLQQSPFPNLFLAGDWTDTHLPSTVESAVLSGDLCANAIAAKRSIRT